MNFYETGSTYIFERDVDICSETQVMLPIGPFDDTSARFGERPGKKGSGSYNLKSITFRKEEISEEEAQTFWKNYEFRLHKWGDNKNRKVPNILAWSWWNIRGEKYVLIECERTAKAGSLSDQVGGGEFISSQINNYSQ